MVSKIQIYVLYYFLSSGVAECKYKITCRLAKLPMIYFVENVVDGLPPGSWLGKERPMPWTVIENNIKYFPKHTLYLYSSKNPYFYEYHFVINVGRKKNNDRNNNNKKDANGLGDIISIHRTFSEENTFLYLSHSAYKILLQCHTKISWSCQALLPYERKGEIEDCDNGHFSNCDISAIPNWTDEMWGRLITFSLCVWL